MPVLSLTNRFLSTIKPQNKIVVYYDKNIKGMMLRLHPTGTKSFYSVLTINGVRTFRFIGTYPTLKAQAVKQIIQLHFLQSLITTPALQNKVVTTSRSFKDCMDLYLEERQNDFKFKTQKVYTSILNTHILPTFQHIPIANITHHEIVNFKNKMVNKQTTYNSCHRFLSAFFNYCVIQDILKINPIKHVKRNKEHTRQEYLTQNQYKDFIQSTHELLVSKKISQSSAFCVLFILLTGCRPSESYTLKHEYIDFKNNVILLPDSKTGKKKIFLSDSLRKLLISIPKTKNNDYVFVGRHGKNHIVNLTKPFKKILHQAGITNKIVIHSLRHSFISTGANSGLPLQSIQMAVQHKSLASTQAYTHLSDSVGENTAKQVGDIISSPSQDVLNQIFNGVKPQDAS